MITKIRLENWRSHADSTLEFAPGTNVIVGSMGAGKTSIMDALCFALFGTFPAANARRVSLEETIRNVPNPADTAGIELEFVWNEHHYRVERILKRKGGNEAKLFMDQRLVAGPKPNDVNAEIEKILGVSYELFNRAVYSEQNNLDFFLRMSPGERKSKFDELLDLDRYENMRSTAVQTSHRLEDRVMEREKTASSLAARLEQANPVGLAVDIRQRQDTQAKASDQLAQMEKELGEKRRIVSRLLDAQNDFLKLSRQIAEINAGISQAEQSVTRLARQLAPVPESLADLTALEKKNTQNIIALENETRNLEDQFRISGDHAAVSLSKLEQNATARKRVEKLEGICPTCLTPVTLDSRDHVCLELDREKKELEILSAKNSLDHAQVTKALAEKKKLVVLMRVELEGIRSKLAKASEQKQLENEIGHHRQLASQLSEALAGQKKQLAKLAFDPAAFQHENNEKNRLESLSAGLIKQIEGDNRLLAQLQKQLESLAVETSAVEILHKRIGKNKKTIEGLQRTSNALSAVQTQLRSTLLENLNAAMAEIWPKTYPYGDFSSCRLLADDKGYELQVRRFDGDWVRVEGVLSGGERASAALTIRLAFALVLTRQLGFLVLDEPTHNLDETSIERFGRLLGRQLPAWAGQVFVITHHAGLEKAATGSLYRIERDKENNGHSRVETLEIESALGRDDENS